VDGQCERSGFSFLIWDSFIKFLLCSLSPGGAYDCENSCKLFITDVLTLGGRLPIESKGAIAQQLDFMNPH